MKKLFFMLLACITLTACDNGGEETPKKITLTEGTSTSQTLYADETGKTDGIKFKAAAPWTASVSEVAVRAGVTWLTLSAYNGPAGEYTLAMTLEQNNSGADRKAEIKIVCGETTITIVVEQKAQTKEEAENPDPEPKSKRVARIDTKNLNGDESYSGTEYWTFRYEDDMLVEMVNTLTESYNGKLEHTWVYTATIDEIEPSGIAFTIKERKDDKAERVVVEATSVLENGRINSAELKGTDYDKNEAGVKYNERFEMTYDANGYLVRTERVAEESEMNDFELTWSGGNYTKVVWANGRGIDEAIYNKSYMNKANLDLNAFIVLGTEGFDFSFGEPDKIFALCGYTGKRSVNLATKITENWDDGSRSRTCEFDYEFDAEGYPTKITKKENKNSLQQYIITYQ